MSCAEIGPVHPTRMSPIEMQTGVRDTVAYRSEEDEDNGDIEENLQHLTIGILDVTPYCGSLRTVLQVTP